MHPICNGPSIWIAAKHQRPELDLVSGCRPVCTSTILWEWPKHWALLCSNRSRKNLKWAIYNLNLKWTIYTGNIFKLFTYMCRNISNIIHEQKSEKSQIMFQINLQLKPVRPNFLEQTCFEWMRNQTKSTNAL